ncbi:transposase [Streptomyces sp. YS415]|uniref:transposase n=1 Tax=Streptomyces sp. YS415 TaxID=2944806 RepID=UPI0027E37348|nr:transposase [Streptomyces sp. YS415]
MLVGGSSRGKKCLLAVGPAGAVVATGHQAGRPRVWTRRQLMDGIRWRTRAGAPWRTVPERYMPWDRVYDLFRRWQRDGTWARIVTHLQVEGDAKGLITWT